MSNTPNNFESRLKAVEAALEAATGCKVPGPATYFGNEYIKFGPYTVFLEGHNPVKATNTAGNTFSPQGTARELHLHPWGPNTMEFANNDVLKTFQLGNVQIYYYPLEGTLRDIMVIQNNVTFKLTVTLKDGLPIDIVQEEVGVYYSATPPMFEGARLAHSSPPSSSPSYTVSETNEGIVVNLFKASPSKPVTIKYGL